ncbi:MAG TPA: cell wall hydrolase [Xanthobacteraceae bacterium]
MQLARSVSKAIYLAVAVALFGVSPTQIGFQDIGSFFTRPAEADPIREPLIASPFGTIHAAVFTFPQPTGSSMPDPREYRLASLDPRDAVTTGSLATQALADTSDPAPAFPEVNRILKGDRLVPRERPAPQAPAPQQGAAQDPAGVQTTFALASATPVPADLPAPPDTNVAVSDGSQPAAPEAKTADAAPPADETAEPDAAASDEDDTPAIQTARIYFGIEPMGGMLGAMQPWAPDATPELDEPSEADAAPAAPAPPAPRSGETIASKGEVTGAGQHPKSPAERLGLDGTGRKKAEQCLADAIYFEARGEQVRGQIAVAQVVMNRVFSGYYPGNVCGVVYQNANRHLRCQFTFACDGSRSHASDEPDAWVRAKQIARETLDGKLWLPDVGKATHYHAFWVHPWWVHEMHKLDRIGVHTFYRPRNWGDGADAPVWGDAASTTAAVKNL